MTATLIGLGMDLVGAVALAYDLLLGPGSRFKAAYARGHVDQARSMLAARIESSEQLPSPPYTEAERRRLQEEEIPVFEERVASAAARLARLEGHGGRAQLWGVVGALLLIVGFATQGYGAYLASRQPLQRTFGGRGAATLLGLRAMHAL